MNVWHSLLLKYSLLMTGDNGVRKDQFHENAAKQGYIEIGKHLISYDNSPLFFSALLAGWLMALGAWLILATSSTISRIASIYMVTFVIGIGGLHHSSTGSVEMFTAYMMSDISSVS